ncbi:hypothetical protein BJV82DRAFT_241451 [Fennellomyces sp. T-0311]|nr:hypothetical protein BJV82DRAFT_241451 [Fennellomyces sp. T-0311]
MEINELVFEEEKPQLQGELQRRKTLPSFVKKLWFIINDSATDSYACWADNGQKIYVPDAAAFAKSVLPQYFKHNNWQSFVRQLNLYGFRKVCDSEVSANSNLCDQRPTSEGWQFRHDCFRRDSSHLLHHIVRKRGHCRQPLSDPVLSNGSSPSSSSAPSKMITPGAEDDEVPARLARIENTMQEMEAKTATAHDCILQLRLTQTRQNEVLNFFFIRDPIRKLFHGTYQMLLYFLTRRRFVPYYLLPKSHSVKVKLIFFRLAAGKERKMA